jgi:hypothetical protein
VVPNCPANADCAGLVPTITGPDGLPVAIPPASGTTSATCVNGYDQYGDACQDWTPITSSPSTTAAAINYLYGTPSTLPPASQAAATGTGTIAGIPTWAMVAAGGVLLLMMAMKR